MMMNDSDVAGAGNDMDGDEQDPFAGQVGQMVQQVRGPAPKPKKKKRRKSAKSAKKRSVAREMVMPPGMVAPTQPTAPAV